MEWRRPTIDKNAIKTCIAIKVNTNFTNAHFILIINVVCKSLFQYAQFISYLQNTAGFGEVVTFSFLNGLLSDPISQHDAWIALCEI